MDFAEWEPVYEAILTDFGFSRRADEVARDELAALVSADSPDSPGSAASPKFDRGRLDVFDGGTVVVAGAGPSLGNEIDRIGDDDLVIGASTAVDALLDAGIDVDLMTTDLDKNSDTVRSLTERGVPVAVHAHGDNRTLLREVVPDLTFEHVLPTTQAAPVDEIVNVGGFTDGDRAAFLADHFGASRIEFVGWDFDDSTVSPTKRRKLVWAEKLLYWLETRRDEPFDVLDGRRETIDTTALPID